MATAPVTSSTDGVDSTTPTGSSSSSVSPSGTISGTAKISTLQSFEKLVGPKLYHQFLEGVAMSMVNQMQAREAQLEKTIKQAEQDAGDSW